VRGGCLEVPGGRIPWTGPVATGEVEVLFRPESVALVEPGAGPLKGRVLTSFFLGDRTRVVVEGVGAAPLVLETSARLELHVGQDVHLTVDPEAMLILDR
jgi:putative spermidine/putrescine transport system ATP-binding protein